MASRFAHPNGKGSTLILCAANKYGAGMGGASLSGCLHDMPGEYRWVHEAPHLKALRDAGRINVIVLADEEDTSVNQKEALVEAVKAAEVVDFIGYKDSSHGAAPGLVCYDSDWNDEDTFMSAKIFGDILVNNKGRSFMSIDACEFGDSLRSLVGPVRNCVSRGINHPNGLREVAQPTAGWVLPRGLSNLVTLAGCLRGKTCADVQDAMGAYGAFSHYEIPERLPTRKVSEIVAAVNADFAESDYDQRCIATGPDWIWCSTSSAM